ncbi:MAG: toxin-antitoxin system YwqK family antitoxin [Candidatus Nitronauta litoralis]|uniref:Toxin-antitoxin system YwqK family antitoxin n=1 Tax=Candidatus Nitronauta litoralis TaxID=2705533 RepID=A0A7T0BU73_9BACT|nr:MAG: toxin-antitoxin system YwqK family antitoxin [Candidatus Nitronauta litoralis]
MPCSSIFEKIARFWWIGLLPVLALLAPHAHSDTQSPPDKTLTTPALVPKDHHPKMQSELFPGGKVKSETEVDAFGLPDGLKREYRPAGDLKSERTYRHGTLHGPSRLYYPGGILKTEWHYRNGKRHGLSIGYYKDGTIKDKGLYQDDLLEGRVILYFPSGKIKAEMNFHNDLLDGASKTYYEGAGIKNLLRYKDGRLLTMETYDREGDLLREQEFPRARR